MKLKRILLAIIILTLLFAVLNILLNREVKEGWKHVPSYLLETCSGREDKDVRLFIYNERNLIPISVKGLGGINVSLQTTLILPVEVNLSYIPPELRPGYPILMMAEVKPRRACIGLEIRLVARLGENRFVLTRRSVYNDLLTPITPLKLRVPLSFNVSMGFGNYTIPIDTFASISLTMRAPLKATLAIKEPNTSKVFFKREIVWESPGRRNFTYVIPRKHTYRKLVLELGNWSMDLNIEVSSISIGVRVMNTSPINLRLRLSVPLVKYSIGKTVSPKTVEIKMRG